MAATSTAQQPSSNKTDFSQTIDSENNSDNHLRVASFSAYLDPTEENFMLKLAESFRKPSSLAITLTDDGNNNSLERRSSTNKAVGEGEIRVFDAERYFKMKIGDESPTFFTDSSLSKLSSHEKNEEDRVDLQRLRRCKNRPATLSVASSSESSWNSQSALIPSFLRTPSHNKQRKAAGNRFFTGFACRGTCSDGKSVYVNKNDAAAAHGEEGGGDVKEFTKKATQIDQKPIMFNKTKQSDRGFQGKNETNLQSFDNKTGGLGFKKLEEKFAFPVLNSGLKKLAAKRELEEEEEKPEQGRDSIEVFGSHTTNKGDIAQNLERKLSMLTWDAIPKDHNHKNTNSIRSSEKRCEDVESDASSDLFEIENISSSGAAQPLFIRQASDGGFSSCMTPTTPTLYAPSEASIAWSVVTASAADFSAVSEFNDDVRITGKNAASLNKSMMMGKAEAAQKSRPGGGLLGCKSHKTVRVAENAYKVNQKVNSDPEWHQNSGSQAETNKVKDLELFTQTQRAISSRTLSSPHSAHPSVSLYMH